MSDKNVIGSATLDEIDRIGFELCTIAHDFDEFGRGEGVYRVNDIGDYVSAAEFEDFWGKYPDWYVKAWMLFDNGQYSFNDVANMTIEEIEAAYNDPNFDPVYYFYTEV